MKILKIATPSVLKITVSGQYAPAVLNLSPWPLHRLLYFAPQWSVSTIMCVLGFSGIQYHDKNHTISTEADASLATTLSEFQTLLQKLSRTGKICVAVPGRTDKVSELAALISRKDSQCSPAN